MAGRLSETERLRVQSGVWEPAGARVLESIGPGDGLRALDVGCGPMGWLRLLNVWVGPGGRAVGSDVQAGMLEAAREMVRAEKLANVELVEDDIFASALEPGSFDLVHARFQLAPLGRAEAQVATFRRLLKPGGWLVLEEPDTASWRFVPEAPAAMELIGLIVRSFALAGGDFDAGRSLRWLLARPEMGAAMEVLEPDDPYLRAPLQFASSLEPRLLELVGDAALADLRQRVEAELSDDARWGTSFALIQAWERI